MAFLLDDTTLKVENYIIVIEFYKLIREQSVSGQRKKQLTIY